jgi:transcription elongation factor Elf1
MDNYGDNYEQIEQVYTCPYCWQTVSVLLDLSVTQQQFVEDCEVCCHPISFSYETEDGVLTEFEVIKLQ